MANKCTVCQTEISEHLGLIGTCGLLRDCREMMQEVLDCDVVGQTRRSVTVTIPIDLWKQMESETADNARYHQTKTQKE